MDIVKRYLTGEAAILVSTLVLFTGLSPEIAGSLVFVAAATVSAIAPRWEGARGILLDGHPAAFASAFAILAVWVLTIANVNITQDQAVALVGGVTVLISISTPRAVRSSTA